MHEEPPRNGGFRGCLPRGPHTPRTHLCLLPLWPQMAAKGASEALPSQEERGNWAVLGPHMGTPCASCLSVLLGSSEQHGVKRKHPSVCVYVLSASKNRFNAAREWIS